MAEEIGELKGKEHSYKIIIVSLYPFEVKFVCKKPNITFTVVADDESVMRHIYSDIISEEDLESMINAKNIKNFPFASKEELKNTVLAFVEEYLQKDFDSIIDNIVVKK